MVNFLNCVDQELHSLTQRYIKRPRNSKGVGPFLGILNNFASYDIVTENFDFLLLAKSLDPPLSIQIENASRRQEACNPNQIYSTTESKKEYN